MANQKGMLDKQMQIVEFGQCRILRELEVFDDYKKKNCLEVEYCEFVDGCFQKHARTFKDVGEKKARRLLTSPAGSKAHFAHAKTWHETRFCVGVSVKVNGKVIAKRDFSRDYFWVLPDFSDDANFQKLYDHSQNLGSSEHPSWPRERWMVV